MCTSSQEISQQNMDIETIRGLIDEGEFSQAGQAIENWLNGPVTLTETVADELGFEMERMDRIRQDFRAKPEDVWTYIKEYYPELRADDIERWESSKALEFKVIDGQKRYFARAGRNLFRIDPEMKKRWNALHPDAEVSSGSGAKLELDSHNAAVIAAAKVAESPYVLPQRIRITQSIELDADAVPVGEQVRCWIPYPRLIEGRQEEIKFMSSSPAKHQIAPVEALQRTIYFEDTVKADQPLKFSVQYEMTAYGSHHAIDADQVVPVSDPASLHEYLKEDLPHIQFTPALKALSAKIVGDETNPYRIAQLLYAWIDGNIPWASAREYSTIRCIPEYAIENGHGDCGIQTLTFMALCRLNGIPTRWQSGWELQPPDDSMHDWGLIYFEPYGWVPMDITYGLRASEDPELKWFYLSGMDSYRIIFNDAYSEDFIPAKTHYRSETVDSQRGEVEWSGGNLYFNKWSWDFDWEIIG